MKIIRDVYEPLGLFLYSNDYLRVAVAETVHGDPSHKIKVLPTVCSPYLHAPALPEHDREPVIGMHQVMA